MIGFKALLSSILKHTSFSEKIVCINIDLDETDVKECLALYANMEFVSPQDNYQKLPQSAKALKNSFYKLETFRIASQYERTLAVDCDIIFTTSITELLNIVPPKTMLVRCAKNEYNSGVMVVPKLDISVYNEIIALMQATKKAHLGDQTIINTAITKKILPLKGLDDKWNTTKREILAGKEKYNSIHYVGTKPWIGEKGYEEIENLWWEYVKNPDSRNKKI
jgi:lipopolysaccharide biosynthesis glycosyltransferase